MSDKYPPIPASLRVPCADPVLLPERNLTPQETELYWGRDRSALRKCGNEKSALVDAVAEKEALASSITMKLRALRN
jgi:hypothetical protein